MQFSSTTDDNAVKNRISWLRITVEGVVIVVSILLAFGIDAWWAGRGERVQEQVHLRRLEGDLTALRAELIALNIEAIRHAEIFSELIAAVPGTKQADVGNLGGRISPRLVYYHLYMPDLPTYAEMLATGSLSLLTSDSVRVALGRFLAAASRTGEWNRWAEQEAAMTMQPYVVNHMPYVPLRGAGVVTPTLAQPAAWVNDPRFWTLATMRMETDREMIADRDSLLHVAEALLRAVQQARTR